MPPDCHKSRARKTSKMQKQRKKCQIVLDTLGQFEFCYSRKGQKETGAGRKRGERGEKGEKCLKLLLPGYALHQIFQAKLARIYLLILIQSTNVKSKLLTLDWTLIPTFILNPLFTFYNKFSTHCRCAGFITYHCF